MKSTGSKRQAGRNPGSQHWDHGRRTLMYAAVVAVFGLFQAGLPVTGTTPPAQAQTAQDQTDSTVPPDTTPSPDTTPDVEIFGLSNMIIANMIIEGPMFRR